MAEQQSNGALYNLYRPQSWDELVGHSAEIDALAASIKRGRDHAYLFSGLAGTGKTSTARIAAHELGCEEMGLMEIDAATNTGIDAMRIIQDMSRRFAFGSPVRAFIVDEAASLSRQSWESLQKIVEEPPDHVYWFFCTTQPTKVPKTIQTRCFPVTFKALRDEEIRSIINRVAKAERIKLPSKVDDLICMEAQGSARQALVYLAKVRDVKDYRDAASIMHRVVEDDPVREFCRFLCGFGGKKRTWARAMGLLSALGDENPESIRIVVALYAGKVLSSTKSDDEARYLLGVLEAFATPYVSAEGNAPLLYSIGRVIYGE